MTKSILRRILSALLVLCLVGTAGAANFLFDLNGNGKTDIADLQQVSGADQEAALDEALGGGDELHKNADGQWEIWSSLGLFNMAQHAEAGDTFVLMQDIDMKDMPWTPVENFNGKFKGELHTISNLKITEDVSGNMGFFGNIAEGGYVEYLNIKDMNLIASEDAQNVGILSGTCDGTIDGCTTTGFVTDARTTLPGEVYVGGMAGKVLSHGAVVSRDVNKLPMVGAEQPINTISSYLGTRFAKQDGHVIGIVGYGADAADSGTLLQDLTGTMPDPNAIAWVVTGDKAVYPLTVDEIEAAIDSSGNSVVTLQQDITHTHAIRFEYPCTFDCNGYTVATPETKNNGFEIIRPGTENVTFTLKNGVLTHYEIGVRCDDCAVVISNMTIVSEGGAPLGLYTSENYSHINKIEDSILVSKKWTVLQYNKKDVDMSANGIIIENSTLIAGKAAGAVVFGAKTDMPGIVTLGSNVDIYTCNDNYTTAVVVEGIDPVKLDGTESVTVLGTTYSSLNHWTTNESVISTEVIAEVTNGDVVKQVTNVSDLTAAIAKDGNSKVKLLKNIERSSQIKIPYSCYIDLNGNSITVTSGNAITLAKAGTENTVTTVVNGTLNHGSQGVRVDEGSLHLSNVTVNGIGKCGASVAYYNPSGAYKDGNVIENCTFNNPYGECIKYFPADDEMDFKDTGVKISDTTLIAQNAYPFAVSTSKLSGIVDLGEGVEIYTNKTTLVTGALYRFLGLVAYPTDKTSVTVNGTEITGMNHWSTDEQRDIINILLIGNSYSTTIPQELYNIATNAGYEVNVANVYYPGCIATQHWDWLNNDVANYQYRHQSSMGGYIRRGDMSTSRYALEDMEWDVIVYQDWFTPNYKKADGTLYDGNADTLEELYENHQEAAYNMMQYLKTNYPNAEHYYYQHWAWQIGHRAIPDVAAANAMWERIDTASNKFADDNDFILIPCGAAFQLARNDERIGEGIGEKYSLWDDDKSHDGGPGGGQFLNGCVFFETIFRDSCTADTTWGESSTKLTAEQVAVLREHAHQAVVDTHGEDWVK